MSGGAFDYQYYHINEFGHSLKNSLVPKNEEEDYSYTPDMKDSTKEILNLIADKMIIAADLAKEIEWFYSGDIGEETMIERLQNIFKGENV